ncbi:cytoplasmic protein [Methylococcus mesophilus]|uniref:cytoplasmic protein n=1 Tax=Methylococcus mesophilus TaxID=2993564 RepID=UPI00224B24B4|nr:cytoplasmic protein [Methylococcus mesophilus]UZR27441.1 cytoplasmic protein [Methylococcus mesophilus]
MSNPDMEKARREFIRWSILLTLNNGRPVACHESVLLSVMQTVYSDATAIETRRELGYLEGRDLVRITRSPSGPWRAELTRHGVDIAEYTIDCEPGIARPVKYW